jgi:hypothetical protein
MKTSSVAMQPASSVKVLRQMVLSFGRTRPDDRPKLVAHIAAQAKALGAEDLPWVANFLKANGVSTGDAMKAKKQA